MLGWQKDGERLQLFLKGQLVFRHEPDAPFLYAGRGRATFDMHHGNFLIEDSLEEKQPLSYYRLVEEGENELTIYWWREAGREICTRLLLQEDRLVVEFDREGADFNRLWINLWAEESECIYGLGEQFSELNMRGRRVPLWVSEQGVGRNKQDAVTFQADVADRGGGDWYTTYYPQPTFVSTRNYFCHVDDSHYMEFDFRDPHRHQLAIWAVPQRLIISFSPTAVQVLEDLTALLGRQPELPDWAYDGVWLGLQGGTRVVLDKLSRALEHGLEVAALWCQDWEGRRVTAFGKQLMWDWVYHREMYPDLPSTIAELRRQGIRFLGYINPFLALEGQLYREAAARGYLLRRPDGSEYHVEVTTFPAALLDLTNPQAVAWIKEVIKQNMLGIGLAGWMADYGEYTPVDAVFHSGQSGAEVHNLWPVLWARANREAVEEAGQLGEVVFFTRAGYSGTARYSTLMWAGDQLVNWSLDDGLASVIPAALSLGMSGFGLHHSDIGGFTSLYGVVREKELFMRWVEQACFSPVMRTHEGNRPDDCWQFDSDEETLRHFARFSRIHVALKPYLQEAVRENAQRGLPVMRHPYIHYEQDWELHRHKYQYLLGRDLLVAPVIQPGQDSHRVYLPDDRWVHLWTGEVYGAGRHTVPAPLGRPPVFYRTASPFAGLLAAVGGM
ncbi:MAG: alpha-glucosidase [Desulfurispora sp.]|uniref:alpha-glucosidase n=1 Tax=Desulfurispora sp. TaxID=3014275 RepID=UPI00404A9821